MLLTIASLIVLMVVVGAGLLGNPDMFIIGNGSTRTYLQWFQPRVGPELPSALRGFDLGVVLPPADVVLGALVGNIAAAMAVVGMETIQRRRRVAKESETDNPVAARRAIHGVGELDSWLRHLRRRTLANHGPKPDGGCSTTVQFEPISYAIGAAWTMTRPRALECELAEFRSGGLQPMEPGDSNPGISNLETAKCQTGFMSFSVTTQRRCWSTAPRPFRRNRCICRVPTSSIASSFPATAILGFSTAFARLLGTGRLAGTGYVSILPVDQGIEHSAGASFSPNPIYFDPENIVKLAIEGGCNGVASTFGVLGVVARKYCHRIPFIVKINHNELLTYPNTFDQIMFGRVRQACDMGAAAVGATIYFRIRRVRDGKLSKLPEAFEEAHRLGMATILWCYLRNSEFKKDKDYHVAADLTGQANHLGVTIQADIIKQKLPENNGGYNAIKFGKTSPLVYEKLTTDHPIDLCRYQVANCYMGRIGLINSGGASSGESDLAEAVRTAVINKRAGGMGLISGRKAFQRPMADGVKLLNRIQDVYLDKSVTVA